MKRASCGRDPDLKYIVSNDDNIRVALHKKVPNGPFLVLFFLKKKKFTFSFLFEKSVSYQKKDGRAPILFFFFLV